LPLQRLQKFREINGAETELTMMPRENDLLLIVLRFPDNQLRNVFTGLVTGVSFTKEYGAVTTINLVAYGLSKFLIVNKMVTDRAIIDRFEAGEQAQVGLTPWSFYFADQTVDTIFQFLMTNELGMQIEKDSLATQNELFLVEVERLNLESLRSRVEANINSLIKKIPDRLLMDKYLQTTPAPLGRPSSSVTQSGGVQTPETDVITIINAAKNYGSANRIGLIQDTDEELQRIRNAWLKDIGGIPELQSPDIVLYGGLILFRAEIESRATALSPLSKTIREEQQKRGALGQFADQSYDMTFSKSAFSSPAIFQLTYLPLMNLALWKIFVSQFANNSVSDPQTLANLGINTPVAKFRGKKAVAYELTLRNAWTTFFSQLQSPSTILDAMRSVAKYAIYENEDGQIVTELPRYNEFLADENAGERIEDFILSNPVGRMEVIRQDLNLVTRLDSKQYVPMVEYLPYTFSSRQFTDVAVLSKYGMRTDAPVYNPNAISSTTASLYAALEVSERNAGTRTLTLQHPADRKFKLGRLHFIAVGDLNSKGGGPTATTENPEKIDGYVGYLNNFTLSTDYGGVINYNLGFNYVRKARLLIDSPSIS